MSTKIHSKPKKCTQNKCCSNLDTLEQLRIEALQRSNSKAYKRSQLKYLNNAIAGALADTNSSLKVQYLHTVKCMDLIIQQGHEGKTFYCKNRWCTICNHNKIAEMINGYGGIINEMKLPKFVTLTSESVNKYGLKKRYNLMLKVWSKIIDNMRNTYGIKFIAIRKFECNYKHNKKTFNPHFHFIIDANACEMLLIQNLWLQLMAKHKVVADIKAQHFCQADSNATLELFKYFSKPIFKGNFNPLAQDFIYRTFKGNRLIQKYGNKKKADTSSAKAENAIMFQDSAKDIWKWQSYNWVNSQGEVRSEYVPSVEDIELNKLVRSNADYQIKKQSKSSY